MSPTLIYVYFVTMPSLLFIAAVYRMNTAIKLNNLKLITIPTFVFYFSASWMAKVISISGDPSALQMMQETLGLFSVVSFFVLIILNEAPFLIKPKSN